MAVAAELDAGTVGVAVACQRLFLQRRRVELQLQRGQVDVAEARANGQAAL